MRRKGDIDKKPLRVSDLFSVYKDRLKAPQRSVVKEFVVVVYEITNISIEERMCMYNVQSRTISCTAPSVIKSEILLRAPEILVRIQKRIGSKNTPHAIV